MSRDKRKGFWAGYKRAGPTQRLVINIAIISLILVVGFFVIQQLSSPSKQEIRNKLDQLLIANEPKLKETYPSGYTGFGVKGNELIVPMGFVPKGFDINWETGKILENGPKFVTIRLPDMLVNTPNLKGVRLKGITAVLRKQIGSATGIVRLHNTAVYCQIIGIDEDHNFLAVGVGLKELND